MLYREHELPTGIKVTSICALKVSVNSCDVKVNVIGRFNRHKAS